MDRLLNKSNNKPTVAFFIYDNDDCRYNVF